MNEIHESLKAKRELERHLVGISQYAREGKPLPADTQDLLTDADGNTRPLADVYLEKMREWYALQHFLDDFTNGLSDGLQSGGLTPDEAIPVYKALNNSLFDSFGFMQYLVRTLQETAESWNEDSSGNLLQGLADDDRNGSKQPRVSLSSDGESPSDDNHPVSTAGAQKPPQQETGVAEHKPVPESQQPAADAQATEPDAALPVAGESPNNDNQPASTPGPQEPPQQETEVGEDKPDTEPQQPAADARHGEPDASLPAAGESPIDDNQPGSAPGSQERPQRESEVAEHNSAREPQQAPVGIRLVASPDDSSGSPAGEETGDARVDQGNSEPAAGRDARGRFAPGNPGGPGRPKRAVERDYVAAISTAFSPEDFAEGVAMLGQKARDGDRKALELLARWVLPDTPNMLFALRQLEDRGITVEDEVERERVNQESRESAFRTKFSPWSPWGTFGRSKKK